jgi:tetratricopeptide (TPR) repeat protein
MDYYQQTLGIEKQQLGPNHVRVAWTYDILGRTCRDNGEVEKAKAYFEQQHGILTGQFDLNHQYVADSYCNLGDLYKGDLEIAKDYYERALKIRQEQLGPNHVDVARSYTRLVTCIMTMMTLRKLRVTMKGHWKFERRNSVQIMLKLLSVSCGLATCIIRKVTWKKLRIIMSGHWKFEKNN